MGGLATRFAGGLSTGAGDDLAAGGTSTGAGNGLAAAGASTGADNSLAASAARNASFWPLRRVSRIPRVPPSSAMAAAVTTAARFALSRARLADRFSLLAGFVPGGFSRVPRG